MMKIDVCSLDNKRLWTGELIREENKQWALLQNEEPLRLAPRSMVKLIQYHPVRGLVYHEGVFLKPSREYIDGIGYTDLYLFRIDRVLEEIQRRREVKVRTRIEDVILDRGERVPIKILNLSASGLYFESEVDYPIGKKLNYVFSQDKIRIPIQLEILRKTGEAPPYGYGCQFAGLLPTHQDSVRRYVFQVQVKNRREGRE